MDNEARWVEEARGGSAEAFSELVRVHHAPVRAYLARYVRDRETADDLAQETFLSAFRSLPTWRGDAPLRMWLLGIARNRALTHLRDEERRRSDRRHKKGRAIRDRRICRSGPSSRAGSGIAVADLRARHDRGRRRPRFGGRFPA
jgi:RNA polymerase sigma factor (sigma-70 family)